MMKKLLALGFALLFAMTGCTTSVPSESDTSTASEPPVLVGEAVQSSQSNASTNSESSAAPEATVAQMPTQSLNVIHEFGKMKSLIEYKDDLSCTIAYPTCDIPAIDSKFEQWAQEQAERGRKEMNDLQTQNASAKGELAFYYNSFLTDQRFASVEGIGNFTYAGQTAPRRWIETFAIDLANETFLAKEDVFTLSKEEDILHLLWDKVNQINPEYTANRTIDASWLDHFLIRPAGIEIVLQPGRELPDSAVNQRVLLTYNELGDLLAAGIHPSGASSPPPALPEGSPSEIQTDNSAVTPSNVPSTQKSMASDSDENAKRIPFQADRVLDPNKPMVALTFDDGPSKTTPKILALLDQYDSRATFCVVGNRVKAHESILKQIAEQGSEISSHTWDHKKLPSLSADEIREELQSANDIVKDITGQQMHWLRPPYGSVNDEVKRITEELDMAIVKWNIDTLDWETRDPKKTFDSIMNDVEDGSIILCHDLHKETGDAMDTVIPELVKRGYQLVTVSELIDAKRGEIIAGQAYRHG